MRIQILSDLHQEFGMTDLNFTDADLIVFAGDVHVGTRGINWLKATFPETPVIYVLGNHEYYKGSYPRTLNQIKDLADGSNIYVLENNRIEINDITFHGCSLWTDFALFNNPVEAGIMAEHKMNDFKMIRKDPSYSLLKSSDTYRIHANSIHWLGKSLNKSKTTKNIVITHHAPSILSIPERYIDDPISAAYASNLEPFIKKFKPNLWIHGHIHEPKDYLIASTRVICNPHGYIDEPYNGFNNRFIIEV